ncbi:modular serine protease-like isoform X1 [Rhopalosiphum padi]|uniref:modular serine protease-like isoform X1 n=1 Tax=Rhopalosiphum padi TaxID=40932 RepID=UPI00298DB20D|nr:modular serine protease-like isoform X1 [Rhopalosiphum padi]
MTMKTSFSCKLMYFCFIFEAGILCDKKLEKRPTVFFCPGVTEYGCESGQCVDVSKTCNGIRDCSDGSDETLLLCEMVLCPQDTFKCKYGACISNKYICDGSKQCADGSDEQYCSNSTSISTFTSEISKKNNQEKPIKQSHIKKTCMIPTIEGTKYFNKNGKQNVSLPHGTAVEQYTIVEEDCEDRYYKVIPERFMVCSESGQWRPFVTEELCLKMCPPIKSVTSDFKCIFEDKYISCLNAAPGTILYQTCKTNFKSAISEEEQLSIQLHCTEDGTWSNDNLYKCIPTCGQIKYNGTVPWSVGLYRKNYGHYDEYYELICGGTLIAPNLVVTAARCIWEKESTYGTLTNENIYKVAVGKYTSDISIKDNDFTQIIDVDLIFLKESYNGSSGYNTDDLAIITLSKQVTISDFVMPVCIDWSEHSEQYTVPNGSNGKVVGWGKTEIKANVSYVEKNTCRDMYAKEFQSLVTADKFCAVSPLGQNITEIFIGSGFTYERDTFNFLTGIVSVMDKNTNDLFAVFTDVSYHIQWIGQFTKDVFNASEYILL